MEIVKRHINKEILYIINKYQPKLLSISIKNKHQDLYKYITDNTKHLSEKCKFVEKIYYIMNNLDAIPKCKTCQKNNVKFINLDNGYRKYCSTKCAQNSEELRNKIIETNLKRYGVDIPTKSKKVQEKTKKTNIKKYGVENVFQNEKIIDVIKKTKLDKYGSYNNIKKIKQTNIDKYGVDNVSQVVEINMKVKNTWSKKTKSDLQKINVKRRKTKLDKYGDGNYNNRISAEKTNIIKYGEKNPTKSTKVKDKIKQTNLKRFGVKNPSLDEDCQSKRKNTFIKKYGVENPFQSDNIKEKIKKTNLEKYGYEFYSQSPDARLNNRLKMINNLENRNGQILPNYNPSSIPILEQKAKELSITDLQHAENGGEFYIKELGYWVDGYSKEKNIVIEYYEKWHKKTKEKDELRKKEIIDFLGCKFIEIKEYVGECTDGRL